MSDIYKHLHTNNFENQYAVVMLAALGIERVPMISPVDNVNGLCVFCTFFYMSNCIFLA